jgi:diguanylate cyclase (GGDEF)-like protein/PAS domain S-box-containing protein
MFGIGVIDLLTTTSLLIGSIGVPLSAFMCLKARKTALREHGAKEALEQIIENLGEGFYRITLDGKFISANPALIAISGFDNEAELIDGADSNCGGWYVDPTRRDEFRKILADDGKVSNFVSEVYRDKTRERIWVTENARLVLHPITKKPSHYEGTVVDVTDFVLRIQEQEKLTKLTSQVPGGLFQLVRDPKGVFSVSYSSSGFVKVLDLKTGSGDFDLGHFLSLIHPEDLSEYYASLKMSRKSGRVWNHDFRVVTDSGKTKWLNVQATPELKPDNCLIWHGYLQDVTATKEEEAQFKSLAYHDALTNLPNRRALIELMNQKIAVCQRRNEYAALLFIDLDTFKNLNDTHGHDIGDLLLIEIGIRLKHCIRRCDAVARLAGDEFVVLIDCMGMSKPEAAKKTASIAQKITASFSKPFLLGNLSHVASASIGGVTFNGDQANAEAILRLADIAMYDVKKSGRNAFKIFDEEAEQTVGENSSLLADLVALVERDELEIRLQPQLDRTGKICGAEALLRWNHPKLGLLTPDKFMPLAEKCGRGASINMWILKKAISVLEGWQQNAETSDLTLAIDIGLQQFVNNGLASELINLAKTQDVNLSKLTIEITEGSISKNREESARQLKRLKHTGIRLSLDDFGVEFSSLSLLADMQLDEIKINGKLVRTMLNGSQDRSLIKSILAMADALGLSTVGVQVETRDQEKTLMEHGCKLFQGFLYGGALTLSDFEMAFSQNGGGYLEKISSEMAA